MQTRPIAPSVTLIEDEHFLSKVPGSKHPETGVQPAKIRIDGLSNPADITAIDKILSGIQNYFGYGDAERHTSIERKVASGQPIPEHRLPFSYHASIKNGDTIVMLIPNSAERAQSRQRIINTPKRPKTKRRLTHEERFALCGYGPMDPVQAEIAYRRLYHVCAAKLQEYFATTYGDSTQP